ncbi:MAG TPA: hypothetical protein VGE74_17715 [Gemmata sp.]
MTEAEWLACGNPRPMLEFLRGKASDRKLRLFACGCTRRLLPLMPDKRGRIALEVAENIADGLVSGEAERVVAWEARLGIPHDHTGWALQPSAFAAAKSGAEHLANAVRMQQEPLKRQKAWLQECVSQAILLRDIFGNSLRTVSADPTWLTNDVVALALGIYQDRAFDRMPILADALQDAGCDNPEVLDHCRSDGPHCRGCWVVDLLLGKS